MAEEFHYIIVGAGSAGCTLASRLSESPETRVLLLEAGPDIDDLDPELQLAVTDPARFQLLQKSSVDWQFQSQPNPDLDHRRIEIPRGRLVGGSSVLMAGMAVRGNRRDYDEWGRRNRGWRYSDVLPYFKKLEANLGTHLDRDYHGFEGPMIVTDLPGHTPAGRAFVEAAVALGHRRNHDFNGCRQEGVGYFQFYLDPDNQRVDSALSYLTPEVRSRPNLTIRCQAQATAVLLEPRGRRQMAVGVAYEDVRNGDRVPATVAASREILVASGTIDSPKLLMLSGIGPRAELRKHGISVQVDLPGVGKNLQDYVIAPVVYSYREGTAPDGVLGYGIEGGLFWRSSSRKRRPDLQFLFNNSLLGPAGTLVQPVAYMFVPTLITPTSRGEVLLGGSYVGSPPKIEAGFLSTRDDLRTLTRGVQQALRLGEHSAFDGLRGQRLFPLPKKEVSALTVRDIEAYIRSAAGTLYHPAGTCRMGPNPRDRRAPAVVDDQLRLHGVDGLRVVDASIMPRVTAGNTHTPTAMIAEKASDLIRDAARSDRTRKGSSGTRRSPSASRGSGTCGRPASPTEVAPPSAPSTDASTVSPTPSSSSARPATLGQLFVDTLHRLGVKYLFGVPGSDVPAIIDGFAWLEGRGKTSPKPIQVPHEMVAMSMAHGYYLASGEPQAVLVYDAVGTANATTAVITAARTNVPIVVLAGATSYSEDGGPTSRVIEPHWAAEPRDQGEILRQFVKWDYTIHNANELETVTRRAFAVAMSEPRGPVYLKLPIDVMALPAGRATESPAESLVPASSLYPDPQVVAEAVRLLSEARSPLIIARSFGRDAAAVPDLVALAEKLTIPVVEFQIAECVNFPTDHSLHLGFDPNPFLDQADVILVIDCPVPWVPLFKKPPSSARVIHLGTDPLHPQIPLWGFPVHLAIAANSAVAVKRMVQEASGLGRSRNRDRFQRLKKQHDAQRRDWARQAETAGQAETSSPEWVSAVVGRYADASTRVVQEYDLKLNLAGFTVPGTYFGFSPSGGLGYGGGAALGVKLAEPDTTVIAVLGDGTYLLGVPTACHMVSASCDLPILWILTNNHGWGAVKLETQLVYPEGWAQRNDNFPMIRFGAEPAYELIAQSVGGTGESIVRPADLPAAIERALETIRREKRQVLLNVDCGEPSFTI